MRNRGRGLDGEEFEGLELRPKSRRRTKPARQFIPADKGEDERQRGGRKRPGRLVAHLVVVLLAVSTIVFASQYPYRGSATRAVVPTVAYSGVVGAVKATEGESYFRPGTSLRTLNSVALARGTSTVSSVRAAGGVAPTSSFSSGVSAAIATSGNADASVTGLAELIDPSKPFELYVTKVGDTISSIAQQFGLQVSTILDNNPLVEDSSMLPLGLELVIPRADGIMHKVAFGETLAAIVGQYDNIDVATAMAFRPNSIRDQENLEVGTYVLLPGAVPKPPPPPPPAPEPAQPAPGVPGSPAAPSSGAGDGNSGGGSYTPPPASGGRFSNPLAAYLAISDPFGTYRGPGRIHEGIDLDLYGYWNSPIYSACNGTVIRTEWLTYSYGYYVVVDCGDGFTTLYAHMSEIHATVGQPVTQGTVLGLSGVTGFTTGEHLHFEIRLYGAPVDPAAYIGF